MDIPDNIKEDLAALAACKRKVFAHRGANRKKYMEQFEWKLTNLLMFRDAKCETEKLEWEKTRQTMADAYEDLSDKHYALQMKVQELERENKALKHAEEAKTCAN